MRLCANENLPEACIIELRRLGHDVLWIREAAPGSTDTSVLFLAQAEERVLITFDKDFGELVFHRGLNASHGVVLFRIAQLSAASVARRVAEILASRADWRGQYSIVEEGSIRMRLLPSR